MEDEGDLLGHDRPPVGADQGDVELVAEGRRLDVQDVGLPRARREVDRDPEPGPALAAARQPELTGDRRAAVLDVDLDRHPAADSDVTACQRMGVQRQWVRAEDRAGGWSEAERECGGEDGERGKAREPVTRAQHVTPRSEWGRSGNRRRHLTKSCAVHGGYFGGPRPTSPPPVHDFAGSAPAVVRLRLREPEPRTPCPTSARSAACASSRTSSAI